MWNYLGFVGYRVLYRMIFEVRLKWKSNGKVRIILYGVGECGKAFIRHEDEGKSAYEIVGLMDDDPKYYKRIVLGRHGADAILLGAGTLAIGLGWIW